MSREFLLSIMFLRKWLLLAPMVGIPCFVAIMLLFVEPVYVSNFKIWSKERQEDSNLLQVQKKMIQEDTYAQVQSEIIKSDRVLYDVVDRMGLATPPPSQSLYSRFFKKGKSQPKPEKEDLAKARTEAVKAMKGSVSVEMINAEVIFITTKMNNAHLAHAVAEQLFQSYKKVFEELLVKEVDEYENFLKIQLDKQRSLISQCESHLIDFEQQHPQTAQKDDLLRSQLTVPPTDSRPLLTDANPLTPSMTFARDMNDVSPVPMILQALAKLEIQRNALSSRAGSQSRQLLIIDESIASNRALLKEYMAKLSNNAHLSIQHDGLLWKLVEARRHVTRISTEYNKLVVSRGSKIKQVSSIALLDPPSFDSEKIYPKKKLSMVASAFIGFLLGLALVYLRQLMDQTYHLPEELREDLDIPLLGVVDHDREC